MLFLKRILNKIQKIKKKLKRVFTKKIYYNNISFKLRANNWITKYRFDTFENKEPETLKWIDNNLRENDVFFDIGANIGVYSLYAASKKINNSKIYSFEPEYSNLNELKFNVLNNGFTNNINIFSIAFGDFSHISFLQINDITPGAALHSLGGSNDSLSSISEGVFMMKIDEFCNQQNIIPNLIKVDIDGNEDKFLNGASNLLQNKNLRSIIIELDDKQIRDKCISIIKKNGFDLIDNYTSNQSFIFSKKK